jgi:tRNA(Arg) A34 adenosine deaminase TadA
MDRRFRALTGVNIAPGDDANILRVVICRPAKVVAESINRVAHEHDVTRHAEVVATRRTRHSAR